MKTNVFRLVIWAMLVAIVLIALPNSIRTAPQYIGKSYIDTENFQSEMRSFYEQIGPAILNPIDAEKVKKEMTVTAEEIREYRNWYGTLPDQIDSIHEQYAQRIEEAKVANNKPLEETLIEERDRKIADIRKNFESDEYVENKIRKMKESLIDQSVASLKEMQLPEFPVAYLLMDVDSGEKFESGDVEVPSVYKKTFTDKDGLFKAYSVPAEDDASPYAQHHNYEEVNEPLPSSWLGEVIGRGMDAAIEHVAENVMMPVDLTMYQNPVRSFEGVVAVPKSALSTGVLGEQVKNYNKQKYIAYFVWGLGALSLLVLFTILKFKKEWVKGTGLTGWYDHLKIDVKVGMLLLSSYITIDFILHRATVFLFHYDQYYYGIWRVQLGWFIILMIAVIGIAFQLVHLFDRWKKKGVFAQEIADSYAVQFLNAFQNMFLNRKIGFQMFVLLVGFFLAGVGLAGVALQPLLLVVYMPLVFFVGLPFLYIFVRRTAYLNRIMATTEAMAEGRLHEEIKIEGKSPLAAHAKNLNNLREGVRSSVSAQAKSERLKTELITNVSHDLRTPLTSIITYTDLLKKEDLSAEDQAKYVEILDKKSQRLKTLIEDLFEVSKMASGNLELNKQRVDLTQLLQQALAEHAEDISASGLDFRINLPETPLVANVDGQRWWRVLDNLIVNALKYAMPGTRVYVTLQQLNGQAQFVLKNISHYEIGDNTDELLERFKRADTSRHTDGSGLGLAIAQSIVDMHKGNMKIEVDGDLFKVTVAIPVIY